MKIPLKLVALFVLSSISTLACSRPEEVSRAKAQAFWKQNELVVERAAKGERVDLNRFAEASLFLQELTGVPIYGDHSTFIDFSPTKETAKSVAPLRQWYSKNKDRLYWDQASRTVKLRPSLISLGS